MKVFRKFFPIAIIFILILSVFFITPTFAESNDKAIETTFFGSFKDDGKGCGVFMVLNFILDILSFGIGIAAFLGITISGVTYITAKDSPQRVAKAKQRILEIIVGLAIYATLYAGLNFLLPGGKLNPGSQCTTTNSSQSVHKDNLYTS